MASSAVRVQLPSGAAFTAALVEAADKYAARRGFSELNEATFCDLARHAIAAVDACEPQTIELVFEQVDDLVTATVRGNAPTTAMPAAAAAHVVAPDRAGHRVTIGDAAVSFHTPLT